MLVSIYILLIFFYKIDFVVCLDMEWIIDPQSSGVNFDIGFQPRMELLSTAPSIHATIDILQRKKFRSYNKPIKQLSTDSYETKIKSIKWDQEIPVEKAIENLKKSFFPFKEVYFEFFKKIYKIN